MPTESCDLCGFESDEYTHQDLLGTLRSVGTIWRWTVAGVDADVLAERPGPESGRRSSTRRTPAM